MYGFGYDNIWNQYLILASRFVKSPAEQDSSLLLEGLFSHGKRKFLVFNPDTDGIRLNDEDDVTISFSKQVMQ